LGKIAKICEFFREKNKNLKRDEITHPTAGAEIFTDFINRLAGRNCYFTPHDTAA